MITTVTSPLVADCSQNTTLIMVNTTIPQSTESYEVWWSNGSVVNILNGTGKKQLRHFFVSISCSTDVLIPWTDTVSFQITCTVLEPSTTGPTMTSWTNIVVDVLLQLYQIPWNTYLMYPSIASKPTIHNLFLWPLITQKDKLKM